MNEILDNTAYPVEDRLEMAKELLKIREKYIEQLKQQIDQTDTNSSWHRDQNSIHRMGT